MKREYRKAERKQAKIRVGLCAPSGGGKTYSALLIAKGLGGRIAMIDTERGSGDLYSDLCDYCIETVSPPYDPAKYVELIEDMGTGFDTIIVDSLTHAWAGVGGLLDQHDKYARTSKNSYTAWREVTPKHNALIDAMLQSPAHIIATMRTKQDYVLEENNKGKKVPVKVGLAPVQREGMDFEFTVVFDLTQEHLATVSKDRTSLFDGKPPFVPSEETGKTLLGWLGNGADPVKASKRDAARLLKDVKKCTNLPELSDWWRANEDAIVVLDGADKDKVMDRLRTMKHHFNDGAQATAN